MGSIDLRNNFKPEKLIREKWLILGYFNISKCDLVDGERGTFQFLRCYMYRQSSEFGNRFFQNPLIPLGFSVTYDISFLKNVMLTNFFKLDWKIQLWKWKWLKGSFSISSYPLSDFVRAKTNREMHRFNILRNLQNETTRTLLISNYDQLIILIYVIFIIQHIIADKCSFHWMKVMNFIIKFKNH